VSTGPIIFGYDGSPAARNAIERATEVFAPAPAISLTVWESALSLVYRWKLPEGFEIARDVVDVVDTRAQEEAAKVAAEGADIAHANGFDAEPLATRAYEWSRRTATTAWQEVLRVVEAREAAIVVLGSRGLSAVQSAVLGSVSHGVVNHCKCPVLVVPAESEAR
jgi:nucleotide-binding universal stress UspA family protein